MRHNQPQLARGTKVPIKNGTFTIISDRTGDHRTFRIKTIRKGPLKDERILGILTGPDNLYNYKGFAFVNDDSIVVWKKFRDVGDWKKFANLVQCLARRGELAPDGRIRVEGVPASLLFQGKCCRCNRALTVPSSIESGIGPVCARIS